MAELTDTQSTLDILFDGHLRVRQPRSGYRYSIDSILLAHQARLASGDTVLDLGTGCGIVSLILCYRYPQVSVWAVEIQTALSDLALRNIIENDFQHRVTLLNADLRRLQQHALPESFDWVITNPPYRRVNSGRINLDKQRAVARHELSVTLEDVLSTASRRLISGGRFLAIYTAERIPEMLAGMRAVGIEPKVQRMVYTRPLINAKRVLVEGIKGARSGITIPPPLVVLDSNGKYSAEVAAMFQP